MRRYLSSVVAIIVTNIILIGFLFFQMSRIQIPITHSFEAKAEKSGDKYSIEFSDASKLVTDNTDIMYISANKNEKVMNVKIEVREQHIFFENSDSTFAENYDQTYTYEVITKEITLLQCIFSRGGKTIE